MVLSSQSPNPPAPLQMNSDGTFSLNIVSGADLVRANLGRNKLREIAMRGEIPGIIKASW